MTTAELTAPPRRGRAHWAVADCLSVVRRTMLHYRRQPVAIVWRLGFPVVSVLLYGFVFGSAMRVPGDGDYKEFLMPGMFATTMAFGFMNTATAVVTDSGRGVIDRFRSMPMAPSAVSSGQGVADLVVAAAELALLAATALAVGWRSDGGPAATVAAFGLLLFLRFSLIWVGVWCGLVLPNAEAAGALYAVIFPLTMVSSVYVSPTLMPGWLAPVAAWNPVSSTVTATRELFGNPGAGGGSWVEQNAVLMAVLWPLLITAVFLPLAVRRFQRLSK
ncbi:ABC transporter permease [Streptomyces purpureus]|uniref:Transport permease protein n=1 Tax=Streptomyces purpureus TaxID=1951 RepID=A0A918LQ96_9ACTN|nr:ABC transporter permease [Streptomyces purpureus]GGT36780.1 transport permease protein [Streptomyces purpureus]